MSKKLAFIVCSNGYGHLKRDIAVIYAILKRNQSIQIDVVCKMHHIEMARKEINFKQGSQLNFHDDATQQEISWLKEDQITLAKYEGWSEELKSHAVLRNADLIVSDNHVLPARIFPNIKLMGSFLWHDVNVVWNDETRRIAKEEHNLIDSNRPDMLCLAGMAMPEVLNFTNPIQLPWYCNKYTAEAHASVQTGIFVTGGGTALINELLIHFITKLNQHAPYLTVYIDSKLDQLIELDRNKKIQKFSFTDADFASLTAIVCRPGIGILTDCVRYNVPAIVINDGYNGEINNNALRVQELGIGIAFGPHNSLEQTVIDTIEFLKNENKLSLCRNQLMNQPTEGAEAAADYLINALL